MIDDLSIGWQMVAAEKVATVRIPIEKYQTCPPNVLDAFHEAATAWWRDHAVTQSGFYCDAYQVTMWGPSVVVDRMVAAAMRIVEWTP